jgi:hypothetical protein
MAGGYTGLAKPPVARGLDRAGDMDYIPTHPPHSEGVLMRRAEEDAAPAGGARNPAPGRPLGRRPSPLRGTALQWAGRGADEGGESPWIGLSQKPPGSAPGSYGPGDRNRRDGAPRGARPSPRTRTPQSVSCMDAPRGAPSPRACPRANEVPGESRVRRRRTPRRKEQGRWRLPARLFENLHRKFSALPRASGDPALRTASSEMDARFRRHERRVVLTFTRHRPRNRLLPIAISRSR